MVEQGWLDSGKRQAMKFPKPEDPKGAPGMEGQTGYLVTEAQNELARQLVAQGKAADLDDAKALVEAGGWTVTLSIDRKKQAQLEKTVKKQLTSKLDPKKRKVDADVQAGAASVDPKTGKVVAMYGGAGLLQALRRTTRPAGTTSPPRPSSR